MSQKLRIVFMGTPDFALPSLEQLYKTYDIRAVFCQPDKVNGRGNKVIFGPVKEYAVKNGIRVCQPETFKNGCCMQLIKELNPQLIVVAAYGKLLPEYILSYPQFGCINVHGSLLPKYRGASPIQYAVLNGEKETGITIMKMDAGLDSGDIISQAKIQIGEYETAGELFDRLSQLGAQLLLHTIDSIIKGTASYTPQNEKDSTYASMITKKMGCIDFSDNAKIIKQKVYGLNPWPSAYVETQSGCLKLHRVLLGGKTDCSPGYIVSVNKNGIESACGDKNTVVVTEIQRIGKKKMNAYAFSLGAEIRPGMSIYSL